MGLNLWVGFVELGEPRIGAKNEAFGGFLDQGVEHEVGIIGGKHLGLGVGMIRASESNQTQWVGKDPLAAIGRGKTQGVHQRTV